MHRYLWWNKPEGKDQYDDVGIDEMIILKCTCILKGAGIA
jgi:hypothetical protein